MISSQMESLYNKQVISERKRGRPQGKNRAPLSAEEQRARNALYEKERRQEQADLTKRLAQELGLAARTKPTEVLASAIAYFLSRVEKETYCELSDLHTLNQSLEAEIVDVESRLAALGESSEIASSQGFRPRKRAASPTMTDSKRAKVSESTCLDDWSLAALDKLQHRDLIFSTIDLDDVGPIFNWSIESTKYI